jgi:hypothetical protein
MLAAGALFALTLALGPAAAAPDLAAARTAFLEAELEAAKSRELYLVYRSAEAALDLRAEGVVLHTFPVETATLERPSCARRGTATWPGVAFRLASDLPERERQVAAPAGSGSTGSVSEAPPDVGSTGGGVDFAGREREALLATVPARFRLRFEPGLEVTVVAGGSVAGSPLVAALDSHALATWRMLRGEPRPTHLLLRLPGAQARRLYFALLPGMRLLVAPGSVSSPPP